MEDWGRRFERLRDKYRRDDGSKWTGAAIERATDGEVGSHYVSDLLRGKNQDPSINKIHAISKTMGIARLDEWFEEDDAEEK